MTYQPCSKNGTPVAAREASFQIDGVVTGVLRGCGIAMLESASADDFTVSRSTKGVHFEKLRVGQKVSCQVALTTNRVLHAHQQTQPMPLLPDTGAA